MINTNDAIREQFNKILNDMISIVAEDVDSKIQRLISGKKEPFLREVLSAMRSGSNLEKRYTASDILSLPESIEETFKVEE